MRTWWKHIITACHPGLTRQHPPSAPLPQPSSASRSLVSLCWLLHFLSSSLATIPYYQWALVGGVYLNPSKRSHCALSHCSIGDLKYHHLYKLISHQVNFKLPQTYMAMAHGNLLFGIRFYIKIKTRFKRGTIWREDGERELSGYGWNIVKLPQRLLMVSRTSLHIPDMAIFRWCGWGHLSSSREKSPRMNYKLIRIPLWRLEEEGWHPREGETTQCPLLLPLREIQDWHVHGEQLTSVSFKFSLLDCVYRIQANGTKRKYNE